MVENNTNRNIMMILAVVVGAIVLAFIWRVTTGQDEKGKKVDDTAYDKMQKYEESKRDAMTIIASKTDWSIPEITHSR